MKKNKKVLVVIEDGVVQNVVTPEGVEVYVLDADGLGNGDGLKCSSQDTQDVQVILDGYRERVEALEDDEDLEYDATDDYDVLCEIVKTFGGK